MSMVSAMNTGISGSSGQAPSVGGSNANLTAESAMTTGTDPFAQLLQAMLGPVETGLPSAIGVAPGSLLPPAKPVSTAVGKGAANAAFRMLQDGQAGASGTLGATGAKSSLMPGFKGLRGTTESSQGAFTGSLTTKKPEVQVVATSLQRAPIKDSRFARLVQQPTTQRGVGVIDAGQSKQASQGVVSRLLHGGEAQVALTHKETLQRVASVPKGELGALSSVERKQTQGSVDSGMMTAAANPVSTLTSGQVSRQASPGASPMPRTPVVTFGDLQSLYGVTQAAAHVNATGQHVVLVQVHPAGLGSILISVQQTPTGVNIGLQASQMQVSQWLSQHASALQANLTGNGVAVSQVAVSFGSTNLQSHTDTPSDRRQKNAELAVKSARQRGPSLFSVDDLTEGGAVDRKAGWTGLNYGGWI